MIDVYRGKQRSQRLQEALRSMRGNAALVEDLSAWLTEAHALLIAKEKDVTPEDLLVVDVLLREHLVIIGYLLRNLLKYRSSE